MLFSRRNRPDTAAAAPAKSGIRREICIYTLIYLVFFALIYLPLILKSGFILSGDGYSMYYPTLINFRRGMQDFGQSIREGHPAFPMMNFNFAFGADNLTMMANYIGLFPYFIFTVLMPESWLAGYLTASVFLLDYLAGIAFLQLCRHFGQSSDWNSLMAFGYVFSWGFISNFLFNPQFMYMFVAFPLMVIGIDRVIHRTGWKLLAFNVFWLCLTSFTMLVYTLPFLAVFALIRVWFCQREHFLKNLFSAFFRSLPVLLCGVLLSGVMLLPILYLLKNSIRSIGTVGPSTLDLLMPEMSRLHTCFNVQQGSMVPLFFCLPGLLILLLFLSKRTEVRAYTLATVAVVALPFFDYAINGFQYSLVRWEFVPALAFSYAAAAGMKELKQLSRKKLGILVFLLALYWVAYSACFDLHYEAGHFCTVFLLVLAVCALIPPVRRFLDKALAAAGRALSAYIKILREKKRSPKQYLALAGLIAGVIGLFCAGFLLVLLPQYTFHFNLIPACGITAVVLLLLCRKQSRARVLLPALALCWFAGTVYLFRNIRTAENGTLKQPELIEMEQAAVNAQDSFGRAIECDWPAEAAGSGSDSAGTSDNTEEDTELIQFDSNRNGKIAFTITKESAVYAPTPVKGSVEMNFSLAYDFPDTNTFHNLLDQDMHTLLNRCGISNEYGALTAFVGFDRMPALYSLFGVSTVGYGKEAPPADSFGLEEVSRRDTGEGEKLRVYHYDYALPLGVTYDSYMSAEEYDAARCSLLPYLMLESALTERGGQSSDGKLQALEDYACDFTLDKAFVKKNSLGMEVSQLAITVNQDVSDCFLYLDVTDVHCRYPKFFAGKILKIKADESEKLQFILWNENCNWPWTRKADRYSFNLGYRENGLKTLSFEFSAEYGDMKLYAIPASVLTDACAARTAETLEQVTFGRNTLDGDITVSSDKLLSVSLLHNDGWRVYVDGKEQPLEKVNRIFLGVMLEEGTHHVRFVYRTPWLTAGLICSGAGILLWIALMFLYRRKKQEQAV